MNVGHAAFRRRALEGELDESTLFELVHPTHFGIPPDEHQRRWLSYMHRGQRYSGVQWADGLQGFVVWPISERAPSQAWLAWARFWAEENEGRAVAPHGRVH